MVFATQILYTTDKMNRKTGPAALKIVGHRGARGLAPENTLAAIRKGLEYKVEAIEIDIRITKDGVPVLHHNRDLTDPTTARYDIRHHNYQELKQHKPDLTTLDEAIELINKRATLMIEIKAGEKTLPIIKVLQIYLTKGWKETYFTLGSKSQKTLWEVHRALPEIPTCVIEPFSGIRATYRARKLGTKQVYMRSWWLWGFFIRSLNRSGYQLYTYTLNNPSRARRWLKDGLAGVVTDRPDLYI